MNRYILPFLWAIAFLLSLFGSEVPYLQASATAAIAIGAGATLLGGLVSDYINTKSQADTNEANKQIARENREWQGGENQLQRDWSERQWNLNNAYNTPSAIAERQRQAGFNPYLLGSQLGQGQSTPATANVATSAPSAPQMQPARIGATSAALNNSMNNLVNYSLQKEAADANAANQQSQSFSQDVQTAQELDKVYPQYRNAKGQTMGQMFLEKRLPQTLGANTDNSLVSRSAAAAVQKQEAEAKIAEVQSALESEFGRKRAVQGLAYVDQQITESAARIGKMASDAKVNDASVSKLKAEAKTEGQKFWTEVAKQYNLKKQGDYYVATSSQINLLKNLVQERMSVENQMLQRRNSEDFSRYKGRQLVRDWMESDEGQSNIYQNFEIGQDVFLNQADKVIHVLSPITPSVNYQEHQYKGLGYD